MATQFETSSTATPRRPLGELLKRLRDDSVALVKQELRLAKAETGEKARIASRNGMIAATGGVFLFSGFLYLLLALSVGISVLLIVAGVSTSASWWLGPLIVGVVVCIVGYGLLKKGINGFKNESMVPERTMHTLQEDQQWIKQKFK